MIIQRCENFGLLANRWRSEAHIWAFFELDDFPEVDAFEFSRADNCKGLAFRGGENEMCYFEVATPTDEDLENGIPSLPVVTFGIYRDKEVFQWCDIIPFTHEDGRLNYYFALLQNGVTKIVSFSGNRSFELDREQRTLIWSYSTREADSVLVKLKKTIAFLNFSRKFESTEKVNFTQSSIELLELLNRGDILNWAKSRETPMELRKMLDVMSI